MSRDLVSLYVAVKEGHHADVAYILTSINRDRFKFVYDKVMNETGAIDGEEFTIIDGHNEKEWLTVNTSMMVVYLQLWYEDDAITGNVSVADYEAVATVEYFFKTIGVTW